MQDASSEFTSIYSNGTLFFSICDCCCLVCDIGFGTVTGEFVQMKLDFTNIFFI